MNALRVGTPVLVEDVELIPIEMTRVTSAPVLGGFITLASKEPAAIVIRSRWGDRALDLEGRDTSLDRLLREVPGLREWMQRPWADSGPA
ncbi:MAG TPA: hypothetical protein VLD67_06420 [Vicinamibacterales bacterium]|nr:hypothetical protein [Vicinamibacterales bacterium]